MSGTPSVLPVVNFHANQDAAILRKNLKGFVCHSKELFNILCARCNWQRQEIARTFNLMYGKNLIKKLRTKLSGAADDQKQRLLLALMEPASVYDAKQLRKALQGVRKKSVLIEVMTTRTNKQMDAICRAYEEMFMTELALDISRKTSGYFQEGDFRNYVYFLLQSDIYASACKNSDKDNGSLIAEKNLRKSSNVGQSECSQPTGIDEWGQVMLIAPDRLLISLCACRRDESSCTDQNKAAEDACKLYNARKHRFERENCFINVLTSQNFRQLRLVFEEYEKDFSGSFCDGLLAIVSIVRNRPAYFAKLLHKYIKVGDYRSCYKFEADIVRLVVSRSECDMADITAEYQVLYKKSLAEAIKRHFSGSYKRGLVALVNGNGG